MVKRIVLEKGRPLLTDQQATLPDNLRTLGIDTNEQTFDVDTIQPTHHDIRQDGSYIVCRTPGHKHGYYIGPDKELIRMPDGSLNIRDIPR